jgi:hypothetical protein
MTSEMQVCAAEGSIVIVNVTALRSDAIIVSSTLIRTLTLPELSASKVSAFVQKK